MISCRQVPVTVLYLMSFDTSKLKTSRDLTKMPRANMQPADSQRCSASPSNADFHSSPTVDPHELK